MDSRVYKMLKRLAPGKAKDEIYCHARSPNTELPDYPYRKT